MSFMNIFDFLYPKGKTFLAEFTDDHDSTYWYGPHCMPTHSTFIIVVENEHSISIHDLHNYFKNITCYYAHSYKDHWRIIKQLK